MHMTSPDNEVDASNTRVEEDDAVDYERHGLPKGIKGSRGMDLHGYVPLLGS